MHLGAARHVVRPLSRHSRQLFSLPDFSSFSPFNDGGPNGLQTYHEQKIFPLADTLYDIVANVESYPSFVPFCTGSRIVKPGVQVGNAQIMEAELTVGFLAFRESYVSKVTCIPFESVQADAASTTPLFKSLMTTWRFQPVPDSPRATLVTLDLAFSFANPLHAAVSHTFFSQVSKQMVQAFDGRCSQVYNV